MNVQDLKQCAASEAMIYLPAPELVDIMNGVHVLQTWWVNNARRTGTALEIDARWANHTELLSSV